MKRVTRNRRLTPEEAARYRAIREQVSKELPELIARHDKRMASLDSLSFSPDAPLRDHGEEPAGVKPVAEPSGEKPKIIIDEDWKTKAQAEKEALERQLEEKQHEEKQPAEKQPTGKQPGAAEAAAKAYQLPPATLSVLLTTLATQALIALGQVPNPLTGKAERDLDQAKHFINTLAMLEQKTAGNRTPEESRLLDNMLHELRMLYVAVENQPPPASA
jgi:uncharacterized protein DUF1844